MAQNRDLWEESDRKIDSTANPKPKIPDEKRCPKCKSIHYAICSAESCGFTLCLACRYSEHPERTFDPHL